MNADPAQAFVDTNILVYALAADNEKRSFVAQELLRHLMVSQTLNTSTQVLQELFVTLTRKVKKPLSADQALRYLERLSAWPVATIDYAAIRDAVTLSTANRISFWDALIVVVAARSGSSRLYTEDLNDGQVLLGVQIVNPFRESKRPMGARPGH
jgi:predicted nucleic acid-binding protein